MTRLTIDLPDDVARGLEGEARKAGTTREQYAAQQIASWFARQREDLERFHQLIREGDESGEPIPVDDAYFERMKEELHERVEQRRTAGDRLESLLLEGLDSGDPTELTSQWFDTLKAKLAIMVEERRNGRGKWRPSPGGAVGCSHG